MAVFRFLRLCPERSHLFQQPSPSAFTTSGRLHLLQHSEGLALRLSQTSDRLSELPASRISCFAQALLASSFAPSAPGPKHGDARLAEMASATPAAKRSLWTDDDQIDALFLRQSAINPGLRPSVSAHRQSRCSSTSPAVPRGDPNRVHAWTFAKSPRQRMFPDHRHQQQGHPLQEEAKRGGTGGRDGHGLTGVAGLCLLGFPL